MSKERLEEIKKKYNYERLGEFIDAKPVNPYELKWLIEQAERVRESKEENINLKAIKAGNEELIKILEQQNKRYREALEEIKSHQVVGVANWGIEYAKLQKIAHEALEGE